ncbi:MAG: bifunctional folylpolyglutamate synthase/dihydrofolate synthase [Desulfohalobiaceae bacterium]
MPHPMGSSVPVLSSFSDFEERLSRLGQFRMVPGLSRIKGALEDLGLERPARAIVQVVGTNGKGSTSCFLESLGRAAGVRTGLYSSPHLVSVRERVKVDGGMLPEELWLEAAGATLECAAKRELTYFEWLTLLGAWIFREQGVELAVVEAGLGGRFDATTALAADLVVVTPIDLDHQRILGDTPAAIAADKAGAMRRGKPVVSAAQLPEAAAVLRREAGERGAGLSFAGERFQWRDSPLVTAGQGATYLDTVTLRLPGGHQKSNALLALESWYAAGERFAWDLAPELCRTGLETAWLPGRMQRIPWDPELVLDAAHNPAGMRVLRRALDALGIRPELVVFTCLKDKEVQALCRELLQLTAGPVLVPQLKETERSLPAEYLAWLVGPQAEAVAGVDVALKRARQSRGPVLVCGSLFLLAEVFRLRPEWMRAEEQLEARS